MACIMYNVIQEMMTGDILLKFLELKYGWAERVFNQIL